MHTDLQSYTGSCHCGQVRFAFEIPLLDKALRCNCSICQRLGALMTPRLPPDRLHILSGRDQLDSYLHGDKEIRFSFCRNCHVFVFFEPADPSTPECFSRANLNCVDDLDQTSLEVVFFNGRDLL